MNHLIMDNTNEPEVVEPEATEVVEDDTQDVPKEDTKAIAQRERQKAIREENVKLKAENAELKAKNPETPTQEKIKEAKKSDEIDFGKLAHYNTKTDSIKIETEEDQNFLQDEMKDTGKSQDSILKSPYFQEALKSRQEARVTKQAVPSGTKRTGSQKSTLDVEYARYKQTGKLPEDRQMRQDIVNKRMEQEGSTGQFSSVPIVRQ